MDATKKPFLIPPEFSAYAEKHEIFGIYERLLKNLIITQPDDPLQAVINWLKEPEDVLQVCVLGPPGVGKQTISQDVCKTHGCIFICREDISAISDEDVVEAIQKRISMDDCLMKGWLLDALPENREQALKMQAAGIYPKHVVLLEAPDRVLIERVVGKRIDFLTHDVYHLTFNPPTKEDVMQRLVFDPESAEDKMLARLIKYHRTIDGITNCYSDVLKNVNADQPKDDVLSQTLVHLSTRQRNNAPFTPRVLFLGPPGSGKSLQAVMLAKKYNLVNIDCNEFIKQKLKDDSKFGEAMKPFEERGVKIPDELIVNVVQERLGYLDAVKKGWILHGFPTTRSQVDLLNKTGHEPNRVIVFDISCDVAIERLSLRTVDPVTGRRYHILYNPPNSNTVKERLKTHPNDEESAVIKKYVDYRESLDDVLEFYTSANVINADQDVQSVFECIETILVYPLPKIQK
ncbi:adenylate kinase 8 isoform X3 [Hydra vulgaris]|uniref:Adenylate kinase 8 isoform X3 n=1 Tax=Hydra vulgaris TaxID=6087 RepID=A0ABM4BE06_HYDVU